MDIEKEWEMDATPKKVIKTRRTNRALRNKTNTMETANGENVAQVKGQNMITKNDTEESLRQKFPNVNQYELEYLLFLTNQCD